MAVRSIPPLAAWAIAMALSSVCATGAAASPADCATTIGSTDAMRFTVSSIESPRTCKTYTITLRHEGKLPVTAMGHSVVVAAAADMAGVLADGVAAGAANAYVRPGDPRVVAHTALVGGGGSTSVGVPVPRLAEGGPWVFFCSFPGHSALMKGTVTVR